jgi:protein gp37
MSPPATYEDLEKRVARLERIVQELARASNVRIENPVDTQSVTQKTTFDWQQPR